MKKLNVLVLTFLFAFAAFAQKAGRNRDIYYEIFIRSFHDSNGDGVGDINGITQKLDYLKDLGITGLWITPVHPSPTYHKYDVIDYTGIDSEYGTMNDYKKMVKAAHKRGIRILLDLVVNHTSTEHPWFIKSSRHDPAYRDFYVWSDTVKTAKNWYSNPLYPGEKYYAFFWERMPDLNFDNPRVREEIKKAGRFWLKDIGIDGFRLDAAQHIYEAEDVEKNNAWWTEFRRDMQRVKPGVFLVGEVWNKDSIVATYLRTSLDACFNFDLSGAIINAVKTGKDDGFIEKLTGIHQLYSAYNRDFVDATFISNHDQDRYRSTFDGDNAMTKLAFAMLMTLPGTPFLYYGEETGMLGKYPDPFRREPFMWGKDGNTSWEKAIYSTSSSIATLEEQQKNPLSFYDSYKNMIAMRKANRILQNGTLSKSVLDKKIRGQGALVYDLTLEDQRATVIHNLGKEDITIPKSPGHAHLLMNGAVAENLNIVIPPKTSVVLIYEK